MILNIFIVYAIYLLIIIFYSIIRVFELREQQKEHLRHEIAEYAHHRAEKEKEAKEINMSKNPEWNNVLEHVFSYNEGDWKLSIIEADAILEKLVDQFKIKGENLGEKLKNIKDDKFISLNQAWEGHIIRNKIAHDSSFVLSQREAKRIIALYERIFREFDFI